MRLHRYKLKGFTSKLFTTLSIPSESEIRNLQSKQMKQAQEKTNDCENNARCAQLNTGQSTGHKDRLYRRKLAAYQDNKTYGKKNLILPFT